MRYIIMCGGQYRQWKTPRQLVKIRGEPIVARTIRLLKENGITDIAISSNIDGFDCFGVPVLKHDNSYDAVGYDHFTGHWYDAFYPTKDPVCYIFGDVVFSPQAIKTIVETETNTAQFFASSPPFAPNYQKAWAEPFALKVADHIILENGIAKVKQLEAAGVFQRKPIMWELWNVMKGGDPNIINYRSYVAINDYTCDIDYPQEANIFEMLIKGD